MKLRLGRSAALSATSALATVLVSGCASHPDAGNAALEPSVALGIARRGEIIERVVAQGRIGAPAGSSAKLAFAEAGILQTVDVRVGQSVRRGDRVAELDRAALAAPLEQAQADARSASAGYAGGAVPGAAVAGARARLDLANEKLRVLESGSPTAASGRIAADATARQARLKVQADLAAVAREQELFAAGVVALKDVEAARLELETDRADEEAAVAKAATAQTDASSALAQARADAASARSDLDAARSQVGVQDAALASARAKVAAAQVAYDNGIVVAPSDGVVLAVLRQPGEAVDSTTPVVEIGPPIGHVATLTTSADAARRIAPGDPVTLRVSGVRERVATGRVVTVVPVVDAATQGTTIVVSGAPPDSIPGESVSGSIAIGRIRGVLVPLSAIVEDPQTGKTVVFVRQHQAQDGDPSFAFRNVDVRADDGETAAIASGLSPGERVAVQGGYMLLAPPGN